MTSSDDEDTVFEAVRALARPGHALFSTEVARRASPAAIREAEQRLQLPLPPLLRRLYREVGNGGFGPGYKLLGIGNGHRDDRGNDALTLHDTWVGWTRAARTLLPICHWGCAIYSAIELEPPWRMWAFDPNGAAEDEFPFAPQAVTFAGWLQRWVAGTLRQPAVVRDQATDTWRATSDEEWDRVVRGQQ